MKDINEIKSMLLKGETVNLECKEAKNTMPKSAYESYSSFANTDGGCIILGVEENKKTRVPEQRFIIRGVEDPQKIIEEKVLKV